MPTQIEFETPALFVLTNPQAAKCMAFLMSQPNDAFEGAAPVEVLDAVLAYELSASPGSERKATYELRHAVERWMRADAAACRALLGRVL